jgi:A/G-specific adenine glycosylase
VPSTEWGDRRAAEADALRSAPLNADWWPVPGSITHVFTHFRLELSVVRAVVPVETPLNLWAEPERCRWVPRRQLQAQALPSVMRKIIAHGMRE